MSCARYCRKRRLLSARLVALVTTFAAITSSSSAAPARSAIKCYSCMSSMYEGVYQTGLSSLFKKPSNFSDQCSSPWSKSTTLKTVDCKSVCLQLKEETEFLSVPFTGYIRGCYDQMLFNGFNQTIVKWYRWLQRDSCHYYNKNEVLQTSYKRPKASKQNNLLYVCTCYSDGCNGSTRLNGVHGFTAFSSFLDSLRHKRLLLVSAYLIIYAVIN